jgi:hypothetical protein
MDLDTAWKYLKEFTVKMFRGLGAPYTSTREKRDYLRQALMVRSTMMMMSTHDAQVAAAYCPVLWKLCQLRHYGMSLTVSRTDFDEQSNFAVSLLSLCTRALGPQQDGCLLLPGPQTAAKQQQTSAPSNKEASAAAQRCQPMLPW